MTYLVAPELPAWTPGLEAAEMMFLFSRNSTLFGKTRLKS